MTIIHVGATDHLKDAFKGCDYRFFDYTGFDFADYFSWSGMFMRVSTFAVQIGADLVIFDFDRPDMINQSEFFGLSKEVKCIITTPPTPSDIIVEAGALLENISLVENGKRPTTVKSLAASAKKIINHFLRR